MDESYESLRRIAESEIYLDLGPNRMTPEEEQFYPIRAGLEAALDRIIEKDSLLAALPLENLRTSADEYRELLGENYPDFLGFPRIRELMDEIVILSDAVRDTNDYRTYDARNDFNHLLAELLRELGRLRHEPDIGISMTDINDAMEKIRSRAQEPRTYGGLHHRTGVVFIEMLLRRYEESDEFGGSMWCFESTSVSGIEKEKRFRRFLERVLIDFRTSVEAKFDENARNRAIEIMNEVGSSEDFRTMVLRPELDPALVDSSREIISALERRIEDLPTPEQAKQQQKICVAYGQSTALFYESSLPIVSARQLELCGMDFDSITQYYAALMEGVLFSFGKTHFTVIDGRVFLTDSRKSYLSLEPAEDLKGLEGEKFAHHFVYFGVVYFRVQNGRIEIDTEATRRVMLLALCARLANVPGELIEQVIIAALNMTVGLAINTGIKAYGILKGKLRGQQSSMDCKKTRALASGE